MIFNDGYYHPLDREYGQIWTPDVPGIIEIEKPMEAKQTKLTPKEVGTTALMQQAGAESIKTRVKHGASRIELVFAGAQKGSKDAMTPESYGMTERRDIRELARAVDLKLSTHASLAINGVSGFGQKGFSEEARRAALDEIKRAIDFAADATTGGAVVVHTGEFPRSIGGYYGEKGMKKDKATFIGYENEEQEAIHYLVNDHTGEFIDGVKENQAVWVPKLKEGAEYLEEPNGENAERYKKARFEIIESYLEEVKKKRPELYERAKERFEDMKNRIPLFDYDENGNIKLELRTFKKFKEDCLEKGMDVKEAAVEFFRLQQEAQLHRALGSARQYEDHYVSSVEAREKLKEAYDYYRDHKEELDNLNNEEFIKKMHEFIEPLHRRRLDAVSTFNENADDREKAFKKLFTSNEREIAYGREISAGGKIQAMEYQDRMLYAMPMEDYALKKSAETLADAGMFAMEKTKQANKKLEKEGFGEKIDPIYISPENLFQNSFGSHPGELKTIITMARRRMTEKLIDMKGLDEKEAKDVAKKHIAATFDIGHAHLWKKYYKDNPDKTPEQNESDFKKWLVGQAKELVDSGIVRHIHITDNMGYHDEHLAIGEGTAPIREIIKELDKAGLKEVIIEPGSTNLQTIWPDSLGAIGSPVYSIESSYQRSFGQIHEAHSGQVNPPYHHIPPIYPGAEEWKIWSGVGLE